MSNICKKKLSGISPYDLHSALCMDSAPFDPFEIADRLGIKVHSDLDLDNIQLAGSITNKNGVVSIWINPLDPDTRQKFTLAHELGHYVHDILEDGNEGGFSNCRFDFEVSVDPNSGEFASLSIKS